MILRQATQALSNLLPPSIALTTNREEQVLHAVVRNEKVCSYQAQIVSNLTKEGAARELTRRSKQDRAGVVFVADHITSGAQKLLRDADQSYMDSGGNCYLACVDHSQFVVFVQGQATTSRSHRRQHRAFHKAGLKLIFALLNHDELVNTTYRTMADTADISRGAVGYVLSDLEELGYLIKIDARTRKLRRLDELMDRWAVAYGERLRPKMARGRFQFLNEAGARDWKAIDLDPDLGRWGGEAAADALTHDLRPESLSIYTEEPTTKLLRGLRMVPDSEGPVEILDQFWTPPPSVDDTKARTVPPLLVYADLLTLDDSRATHIANRIFTDHLMANG